MSPMTPQLAQAHRAELLRRSERTATRRAALAALRGHPIDLPHRR